MADDFAKFMKGLSSPLSAHELADFSSDDHEFDNLPREILVIGSGTMVVRLQDSSADLSITFGAGTFQRLPWRVSHVRDTTASTISVVGFW